MPEPSQEFPQWRRDPVRGHWTIIAPDRATRPQTVVAQQQAVAQTHAEDPFLAGNEHLTPEELFAVRHGADEWSTRVVTNRYPAMKLDARGEPTDALFASRPGRGHHEVIVECPHFETELSRLSAEQVCDVLTAWQSRLQTIAEEGKFAYSMVFKNSGKAAGASLAHAHSQLIAMEFPPPDVEREMRRRRTYLEKHGRPLMDDVIQAETTAHRLIDSSSNLAIFCPFASRFAGEMWIAPRCKSNFLELADEARLELAGKLRATITALLSLETQAAYNILLCTPPYPEGGKPWARWRLEVCPRIAGLAGFELATGCYINTHPPELIANRLREVWQESVSRDA